jgi:hypothetical protein
VISPGSYYASATWPHNLVRFPGAAEVHAALKASGFKVQVGVLSTNRLYGWQ